MGLTAGFDVVAGAVSLGEDLLHVVRGADSGEAGVGGRLLWWIMVLVRWECLGSSAADVVAGAGGGRDGSGSGT